LLVRVQRVQRAERTVRNPYSPPVKEVEERHVVFCADQLKAQLGSKTWMALIVGGRIVHEAVCRARFTQEDERGRPVQSIQGLSAETLRPCDLVDA
jgi:hypothetical protein